MKGFFYLINKSAGEFHSSSHALEEGRKSLIGQSEIISSAFGVVLSMLFEFLHSFFK